jgi:CubicO group peptidase (beta-lactamase class C family)
MGGVAGHAGLFSTAGDLEIFARMLLAGGELDGARILSRESVAKMALPQTPIGASRLRGFGWDLAAPLASKRAELAPVGSYGHTGYTGTMMWIDPAAQTYVIVLANRTYPDGRGDAQPLRDRILELVSTALEPRPALSGVSSAVLTD